MVDMGARLVMPSPTVENSGEVGDDKLFPFPLPLAVELDIDTSSPVARSRSESDPSASPLTLPKSLAVKLRPRCRRDGLACLCFTFRIEGAWTCGIEAKASVAAFTC